MAKTKVRKETEVRELATAMKGASAAVLADLSRLRVADSNALRRQAKKEGVSVKTAKKTLLRVALKESGLSAPDKLMGSVSLLFGFDDPVSPAKVLESFRKGHENMSVIGGFFESHWVSAEQVKALSELPSKQELIAKAVGSIRAPLAGLVNVLQGNLRNLVYALNAIKNSKSS